MFLIGKVIPKLKTEIINPKTRISASEDYHVCRLQYFKNNNRQIMKIHRTHIPVTVLKNYFPERKRTFKSWKFLQNVW